MYDEHEKWHDAREGRLYGESRRNCEGFWGFTLSGGAKLEELARFYGLKIPDLEAAATLAGYLGRAGNGAVRPGYRAVVDGADLLVLETENGIARKVGLELRPRRRHTPWLRRR
ncbi:MAG: transporter associated domain-containing protein [Betaproteobacteria bacterium]